MDYEFSSEIIYSFLQPLELLNISEVDKFQQKNVTTYLLRYYNTLNILDFVCPRCASWLNPKTLENYSKFRRININNLANTTVNIEEQKRHAFIQKKIGYYAPYKRSHVLCGNCERQNIEINFCRQKEHHIGVNGSPFFLKLFKYKGDRKYIVVIKVEDYNVWAFVAHQKKAEHLWNEFFIDYRPADDRGRDF
jgi:hypothetical protein